MFRPYSYGPRAAWLWIIEYVSSFPQLDISIISGLIETAPILPEDLEENTSERVALRCLEELFGPQNSHGSVAPVSRAVLNPSASCDDVLDHILYHILQKVPLSDLKNAGPELLRWDGHSFIEHKRATLPKCALEQLKDVILLDDPYLDGNENGPPSRSDDSNDENGNQEGNLIPQIKKNEELLGRNPIPSKRSRDELVAGNSKGIVSVNHGSMQCDLHLNAKKSKLVAKPACTIQAVAELPIHLHDDDEQLEDESQRIMKVTEIGTNNLGKVSQIGEGNQDLCVASRTPGLIDAVGRVELLDNQMENVQNDNTDMMVEQKHGDIICPNVVINESSPVENGAPVKESSGDVGGNIDQDFTSSSQNSISADGLQENVDLNGEKADMDHPCVEQICEDEDEIFNISLKKNLFLSSQHMASQDPVQNADWTEQNSCVKCNQNGRLLVCTSSGCLLAVHESCLNCPARFDDKGHFLCPFCACSVSISNYLEAKNKIILARKKLVAFMGLMGKLIQEQGRSWNHSKLNGNENLAGILESGHLGREHEHKQEELPAKLKTSDDNPTTENTETFPINQVEVEGDDILKEVVGPQITDASQKLVNSDGEESSTSADDKYIISSHSTRSKKSETRQSFSPTRRLRRKKAPWTNDEEEMLRKGVQELANEDGTVPWKRILEFGTNVFLMDRTATDLKNKWRSMCKDSPGCK
ncbi:hypothetical protein E1A91_A09G133800v1 [Gossypium mustelinum]|uniref:Myb-like domain-containing protein n=1 Tax=Gossypium mustelinum TaxID=34275 RepID=A0A5D2XXN5_GOSMU|nr:hypothetical protein E1A91_A09G133800v1 [Gossypium mustelinum]TYJ18584.1 hypothetical protein E1A91_A09G133800v1 [Gossypium mustelinum]TYJ18586.1 hypothetical protein E1A91_A09G133800v1 [Gossypium mustelinum]